jgi:hypothetical protein
MAKDKQAGSFREPSFRIIAGEGWEKFRATISITVQGGISR